MGMRHRNCDLRFLEPTRLQTLCGALNVPVGKDHIVSVQNELIVAGKRANPEIVAPILFKKVAIWLQGVLKLIKIKLSWRLIPSRGIATAGNQQDIEDAEWALQLATKIQDQIEFTPARAYHDAGRTGGALDFKKVIDPELNGSRLSRKFA